jgi:hypothetical protein
VAFLLKVIKSISVKSVEIIGDAVINMMLVRDTMINGTDSGLTRISGGTTDMELDIDNTMVKVLLPTKESTSPYTHYPTAISLRTVFEAFLQEQIKQEVRK